MNSIFLRSEKFMEFSKDYINDSENINYRNNFFVNVTKELSLIVWVLIVLLLIIW